MRREGLKGPGMVIAALSYEIPFAYADITDNRAELSFGIVTDTHCADTDPRGARHYRESTA